MFSHGGTFFYYIYIRCYHEVYLMTVKFNLEKGMKGEELINELNGKVSGETNDLYQVFATPHEKHMQLNDEPVHEVIASNGTYAIIEKKFDHMVEDGLKRDRSYFLSGINDEGFYFVHPMDQDSIVQFWKHGFEAMMATVNKSGDGYYRVQGDVLQKFVHKLDVFDDGMNRGGWNEPSTSRIKVTIDGNEKNMNQRVPEIVGKRSIKKLGVITNEKFFDLFQSHKLHVGDKDMVYSAGEHALVMAESITMKHPEHKAVTITIPKDHCLVLTTQKGVTAIEEKNVGFD